MNEHLLLSSAPEELPLKQNLIFAYRESFDS